MLAADSMLGTAKPGVGIPGGSRIRCRREMACAKQGFRPWSAQEPRKEGGKVDSFRWMSCFKDPMGKGKKVEVETVRGGEDLWDVASTAERGSFPEHLVIMVNGLIGSAEDWRFAAEQFVKKLPNKVIVHRSECNTLRLTFDGVDLMGERLAEEVRSVVKRRGGVRKISFVAHSLGGLVARYAIGRLYEPITKAEPFAGAKNQFDEDSSPEGRIAGLEPMNFVTFASPHLGSRGHKQIPLLCGLPFLEQRASKTAHLIVGRTGKHLFLTDNDDGKPPLLLRMVDDCDDIKFRSALRSFKRCVAYANANYDHIVGWRTSSIRRQHELPEHHLLVKDEKYPHIVFVDKENTEIKHNGVLVDLDAQQYDLEGILGACGCKLSEK
ncbi:putative lipase ROG1 isoform X2 [Phoenix dactylifera]|uniref:Lipase ROG1 isoform X2 n=1 Tax=Phoenix dactylifera TaxID=42345 RepID=A0A8B9AIJ0_PHODC|nr:putative lipase ROG1 isoform X2 [Phoenix dactylifera]